MSIRFHCNIQTGRLGSLLEAVTFGLLILVLCLSAAGEASAALATPRKITLSNSAAGTAGGTNVMYSVAFSVSSTATNIGGIVIDFCSNSPIAGDTCTAPTGFNTNKATLTVNNQTNISGLSVDTTNSTASKLILTKTAGTPTAAAISFDLGNGTSVGMTNPTALATYYTRIYTYTTIGAAQAHNTAAPTGFTDEGGVALSTANKISLDFDIPEALTFCVYTAANCASGGAAVNLGDTNGYLRTSGPFVDKSTKFDVITNAGGLVSQPTVVNFKAALPASGSNTLPSIGTSGTASTAGISQFGLCSYRLVGSQLSIQPPYNNGASDGGICLGTSQTAGTASIGGDNLALFAFNTPGATSTYGDLLASVTPTDATAVTGVIVFIGNISTAQAAGAYTTSFNLIATGSY